MTHLLILRGLAIPVRVKSSGVIVSETELSCSHPGCESIAFRYNPTTEKGECSGCKMPYLFSSNGPISIAPRRPRLLPIQRRLIQTLTGGFKRGEMVVLVAPGLGKPKTALSLRSKLPPAKH